MKIQFSRQISKKYDKLGYISRHHLFIIIVISSFLLRLLFRSNYLDEWDSIQFALAIKDYSIIAHQPHPPGYPIYILFARTVNFFFNNQTQTLTFLSTLFGSLSLIPVYLLSKKLFNEKIALISSLLLSLTPAHLLYSEVAMTDIVGIFFITLTMYLLYLGFEHTKYLYIASLVIGLTAGIRVTDIILMFILLIVLTYRYVYRKREFRPIFISILLVIFGIGIWLIPIILDTGGIENFIKVEKGQWDYNSAAGTLNGGKPVLSVLGSMFNLLFDGWTPIAFFFFILMTLIFITIKLNSEFNRNFIDKRFILLASWFMIFFLFSIFFHVLYTVRYILPIFPVLSIIFSYSICEVICMTRKRIIKVLLITMFIISIIFMANQGIIGAYTISTTIPAPIKATEFIKDSYDYNNTIIVAAESLRHIQYYIPNYTLSDFNLYKINDYILENKTVISENFPITFAPIKVYRFERKKIYPKHEIVVLYENKDLQSKIVTLEKDGWYGSEILGNMSVRWIGNDTILRLYSYDNYTNISFDVISFYRPKILYIYNDNDIISIINVTTKFSNISINTKKGINIMHLHVQEGCERPIDHSELRNMDTRCLGIAFAKSIDDRW